ncbi:ComEA family DNA-binding protein [Paenibacillus sp. UNC451MF]|uniref:ComEA family DNA-binding protein n=1 Tax=Paenibacillus sp. UNC451MF TaxID=1449063 RepID=UPI00068CA13B|nr:ComEA family DNA-binding protein [Paenibacillus sp. UNC451MF]
MALSFVNKKKSGTVLLVVMLTVALGGWFGYTAWKEAIRESTEWRLANDDMQRLLTEQAEQKAGQKGTSGRGDANNSQAAPKNSSGSAATKEASAKSQESEAKEQAVTSAPADKEASSNGLQPSADAATEPVSSASNSLSTSSQDSKLNINKATEKELDALPGIGESKAKAIVAYREKLGGRFKSVDQLLDVKGIGDKLLAKMKPYITVEP